MAPPLPDVDVLLIKEPLMVVMVPLLEIAPPLRAEVLPIKSPLIMPMFELELIAPP